MLEMTHKLLGFRTCLGQFHSLQMLYELRATHQQLA